jgi:hypothetical protein
MDRIAALALLAALAGCAPALTPVTAARTLDEGQLRAHLFAFADDSMLGRRAGTESGLRASAYISSALARAGLEPAGESGTFYQTIPLARTTISRATTISIRGESLSLGTDVVIAPVRAPFATLADIPIYYLGQSAADTTGWPSREALRGVAVMFDRSGQTLNPGTAPAEYLGSIAATLIVTAIESLPPIVTSPATGLAPSARAAGTPPVPVTLYVSGRARDLALAGTPAQPGRTDARLSAGIHLSEAPLPTRNVVAVLRGSDPALRDEYVVIMAHPDHVGTRTMPLDHDSLRAVLRAADARSRETGRRLTAAERSQLTVNTDTLGRAGPPRADSIFNGADDNASGSTVVLALAERFARSGVRPRRSILFLWPHAEEMGLLGSRHFADFPTVPREQIVAAINMDMVGRGRADDIPGGGPRYVQIVGSRRLSTQLGDLVERVNASLAEPMDFDYSLDAPGHPERIYCRSDHANLARYGIPIVFFTTGLHPDYHQLTDEPQYIDYGKMRRVGALAGAVLLEVANADDRPVVNVPVPDPFAPCRQ